jgi:hypothetical protein
VQHFEPLAWLVTCHGLAAQTNRAQLALQSIMCSGRGPGRVGLARTSCACADDERAAATRVTALSRAEDPVGRTRLSGATAGIVAGAGAGAGAMGRAGAASCRGWTLAAAAGGGSAVCEAGRSRRGGVAARAAAPIFSFCVRICISASFDRLPSWGAGVSAAAIRLPAGAAAAACAIARRTTNSASDRPTPRGCTQNVRGGRCCVLGKPRCAGATARRRRWELTDADFILA